VSVEYIVFRQLQRANPNKKCAGKKARIARKTLGTTMKIPKIEYKKENLKGPSQPSTCKLLEMVLQPLIGRY